MITNTISKRASYLLIDSFLEEIHMLMMVFFNIEIYNGFCDVFYKHRGCVVGLIIYDY